jgi:hypothetical protein
MILIYYYATASSKSLLTSLEESVPTRISEITGVPVPAGINLPTATFSFNPYK